MEKDFDGWNYKKKIIDDRQNRVFCHEREVWWCSFGLNVGSEQNGAGNNFLRPVAVIQVINEKNFFGVALTGKEKRDKHHFYLGIVGRSKASAILTQVRTIDTKRLGSKICILDFGLFEKMKSALQGTLFPVVASS